MKLASRYFETLLTDADPIDAIATLSGFWQHRVDTNAPLFGLPEPEYNVQLILIYTGEVGNGGHAQYFMNRGTTHAADTIAALGPVGLGAHGGMLAQAASDYAKDIMASEPLDAAFSRCEVDVDMILQRCCRIHQEQILCAERGDDRG